MMKERMKTIIEILKDGLYEREDIIPIIFLAALAGQNIFLYGPPGTAKSLISRRLAFAFDIRYYFEYLMHKFSTPEEVFGPVSISELKRDNYVRITEGYLPSADFAFLDEIWKSSPAILNTLLTIINEKKFKNGNMIQRVPLKTLIAASNETPPENQGLEALYDRFLVRLYVPPIKEKENFEKLLLDNNATDEIFINDHLIIKRDEIEIWSNEIKNIQISKETINLVYEIKLKIEEENNKNENFNLYISDRRWQHAMTLLKASAFFSDRKETNIVDVLLLPHCLWTDKNNMEKVFEIVKESVKNAKLEIDFSIASILERKEILEEEIHNELYYPENVYKTVVFSGKEYFECSKKYEDHNYELKEITFYVPVEKLHSKEEFNPVDNYGNEIKWIKCRFDNEEVCHIKINSGAETDNYYLEMEDYFINVGTCKPQLLFKKGEKKEQVNPRLLEAFKTDLLELKNKLEEILLEAQTKKEKLLNEIDTPFIPPKDISLISEGINKQVEELKEIYKDFDRLEDMLKV